MSRTLRKDTREFSDFASALLPVEPSRHKKQKQKIPSLLGGRRNRITPLFINPPFHKTTTKKKPGNGHHLATSLKRSASPIPLPLGHILVAFSDFVSSSQERTLCSLPWYGIIFVEMNRIVRDALFTPRLTSHTSSVVPFPLLSLY